jgi:hypothetical protein
MGAAMTPATAAITEGLPAAQQGVGSALNDLSREVGGALGIAVIGSIVTAVYRSNLHLAGVPAGLADQARGSFALAIHAGGPVKASASSAFVDGIHSGLLYAAGAALLAAVTVSVLLSTRRRPGSADAGQSGRHQVVRGIDQDLLEGPRQVDAPHQSRGGGQQVVLDADPDHVMSVRRAG